MFSQNVVDDFLHISAKLRFFARRCGTVMQADFIFKSPSIYDLKFLFQANSAFRLPDCILQIREPYRARSFAHAIHFLTAACLLF